MQTTQQRVGRQAGLNLGHGIDVPGLVRGRHGRRPVPGRDTADDDAPVPQFLQGSLQSPSGSPMDGVLEVRPQRDEGSRLSFGVFHQQMAPSPCDLWDNSLDLRRCSRGMSYLTPAATQIFRSLCVYSEKGLTTMKGNFYESERVALFIDGANLYSAARALGFDIDYRRLLKVFREKGRMVRAYYYTALVEDQEYSPIRPLIDWLDYNGYTMVTKPTKEFTDAMGRRKIKGNMDIELAIDVLEMAEHLDHVILFSGDGDFRRLVER